VRVTTDADFLESEARLVSPSGFEARVKAAIGSPAKRMTAELIATKVRSLADGDLDGVLEDPDQPAKVLVETARLV